MNRGNDVSATDKGWRSENPRQETPAEDSGEVQPAAGGAPAANGMIQLSNIAWRTASSTTREARVHLRAVGAAARYALDAQRRDTSSAMSGWYYWWRAGYTSE